MKRHVELELAAIFGWSIFGCNTLDRFDTKDGEAYCGSIVSAAFVREGFPPDLRLRMTLDTDQLSSVPGTLTTDDAKAGPCAPTPRLHAAPMRVTEAMLHDPLSTFDFGTGRDHNFMAWVDSSCSGPMLAVVSLLKNDDVEVRLLMPPAATAAGEEPPPASFALFQLTRQKGDCGF
ncbi:MAG: hypothetical protein U0263_25520 [Polyangiaceae bacterium]